VATAICCRRGLLPQHAGEDEMFTRCTPFRWRVCTLDYPQHIETLVKITRRITTDAAREQTPSAQFNAGIAFVSSHGLAINTEFHASQSNLDKLEACGELHLFT
jgi:hypothetical protein